jgi:hypothetical protein
MDWLVPVRPPNGERFDNPELRTAIRSWVTNGGLGPDDTLWVIGHKPRWLTGDVRHLPGNRFKSKPLNVWDNLRRAIEHPEMPEQVIAANDDFVIVEPADPAEIAYRGMLADHIDMLTNRTSWWIKSLRATLDYLRGVGINEPLSYELHRPLLVDTARMEQALREASWHSVDNPPQWRTVYGNRWQIGGTQQPDGKIYPSTAEKPATPFWSTTDSSFKSSKLARWAVEMFPTPSRFERQ